MRWVLASTQTSGLPQTDPEEIRLEWLVGRHRLLSKPLEDHQFGMVTKDRFLARPGITKR